MQNHTFNCNYADIVCPKGCGEIISKVNQAKHLAEDCGRRVKNCDFCQKEVSVKGMEVHLKVSVIKTFVKTIKVQIFFSFLERRRRLAKKFSNFFFRKVVQYTNLVSNLLQSFADMSVIYHGLSISMWTRAGH